MQDKYDFEYEIKTLQTQTNKLHKSLKSRAESATHYLNSAQ